MGIDLVILVISRWGERVGRGNSVILCSRGRLAQRLAQVLYTHKAGGSNPSSPTKECEREGRVALAFLFSVRGFEPRLGRGAEETYTLSFIAAVRRSSGCSPRADRFVYDGEEEPLSRERLP